MSSLCSLLGRSAQNLRFAHHGTPCPRGGTRMTRLICHARRLKASFDFRFATEHSSSAIASAGRIRRSRSTFPCSEHEQPSPALCHHCPHSGRGEGSRVRDLECAVYSLCVCPPRCFQRRCNSSKAACNSAAER